MDGGSSALLTTQATTAPEEPSKLGPYLVAAGYGTQGLASIGGAYSQYKALNAQGNYQKNQYDFNSKVAEMQAEDALQRGEQAVAISRKQIGATVGSQRTASAAQGVDVNSGSAVETQADTKYVGAMNAIMIRNNAWREAWGYKNQALGATFAGEFAKMSASNQAANTLLTGGLNAVGFLGRGAANLVPTGNSKNPGNLYG